MNPLSKLEIYAIVAVVLALAVGGAYLKGHHSGYVEGKQEIQVKFDAFVNDTKAAGLKAEQDKIAKEKKDGEQIAAAVVARDDALRMLRVQQARPRGGFVPGPAAGSAPSGKVCYDANALDAALRKLDSGVSQLVGQGDQAVIDALTLLKSWPNQVR